MRKVKIVFEFNVDDKLTDERAALTVSGAFNLGARSADPESVLGERLGMMALTEDPYVAASVTLPAGSPRATEPDEEPSVDRPRDDHYVVLRSVSLRADPRSPGAFASEEVCAILGPFWLRPEAEKAVAAAAANPNLIGAFITRRSTLLARDPAGWDTPMKIAVDRFKREDRVRI